MGSIGESLDLDYDVIIIGAGLSGIYSLYRMKQLGLRTVALENGSSEGGTWWWNTYPGCRFDSESWSYVSFAGCSTFETLPVLTNNSAGFLL